MTTVEAADNAADEDAIRRRRNFLWIVIVALLLAGLPLAVWADLRALSREALLRQAEEFSHIINEVRNFYAEEILARVVAADGQDIHATHNFRNEPGGIPIPATFSLELGRIIGVDDGAVGYRFVSDYPFAGREPHALDDFEQEALKVLRNDPTTPVVEVGGTLFHQTVRLATPIIMGEACAKCHNAHPDSPKHDWKAGDVRGIQSILVNQPIEANLFAFKYLLIYFLCAAVCGIVFIVSQIRQSNAVARLNKELRVANDFLASVSLKIAKYLSPQVYKSIFSGEKDTIINTERKKLTIFFSDIADFTATTERLQPEELTSLLNEYLTEMSAIALQYGGTIDKFIGDAILVFFGDPETRGTVEDAHACVEMAVAMQRRLADLNDQWLRRGIEKPFRVRMGINTGYCNVGNFGSADRMDYTIIGAEANLAARLQQIASTGEIVMSYETYALVTDIVAAKRLPPISMKGISREVEPYAVEAIVTVDGSDRVMREQHSGVSLYLDPNQIEAGDVDRIKQILADAIARIEEGIAAKRAPETP
ncbi:MAG: adenylate/guanylate cyclase domain-containing protein [Bauldia sp.]|nr:adenylate/guanylate cyclase domain-containing protein [Bauldia sp.]